jgi:membrane peptidoglycan carboxypeptidase
MTELLKSPVDLAGTGTASALRSGVIPGMDPLSDETWKLKAGDRKKRTLAFPLEQAGEIAGKTGTATNADGKTSDVWLLLFVPGPPGKPENGVMLGFWMGKDSKDHPLGERGSTGGPALPSPVAATGCIRRPRCSPFSRRSAALEARIQVSADDSRRSAAEARGEDIQTSGAGDHSRRETGVINERPGPSEIKSTRPQRSVSG